MRTLLLALCLWLLAVPALAADQPYTDLAFGLRDGAMAFSAKTVLPEGASVGAWLHQTQPTPKALYSAVPLDYPQHMDLTVTGGTLIGVFRSTKEYGLKKGPYEIVFTIPAVGKNTQSHRCMLLFINRRSEVIYATGCNY